MKNFLIFSLLIGMLLSSCGKEAALSPVAVVSTDNHFMELVNQNVYPVNKLSEASVQHFNENLVLDENSRIISGSYEKVQNELNQNELQDLFNLLLGGNVVVADSDGNISNNEMVAGKCLAIFQPNAKRLLPNYPCVPNQNSYCITYDCGSLNPEEG